MSLTQAFDAVAERLSDSRRSAAASSRIPARAGDRLAGPLLRRARCSTWSTALARDGDRRQTRIQLALVQLHRRALAATTRSSSAPSSTPARRPARAPVAYPLAYTIAFKAGRWRNAAAVRGRGAVLHHLPDPHPRLGDDPLRREPRDRSAHAIGLAPRGHMLATGGAVIAGLTYNFLPFMILPIYASLERIDVRLIEAAKDLYASAHPELPRVTVPLSVPGSSPARCSPSSRPPATTSTPSSSAAPTTR